MNGQPAINKRSGFHEYRPHDKFCKYHKTNRYLRAIAKGEACVFEEKKPKKGKVLIFDGDERQCQANGELNVADQANGGQLNEADNQTNGQIDEELDERQADHQANRATETSLEENLSKLDDLLQRLVLCPIGEEERKNLKERVSKCSRMMDEFVFIVDPSNDQEAGKPTIVLINRHLRGYD